jgi:ATP:ADP antiporter, AAA family
MKRRLVDVRPGEGRALALSFLAFFCLLTAYYILRPIREERAIAAGAARLPVLYAWTFGTMLALVAGWSAVLARLPRKRVVPAAYQFFVANLLVFFGLFRGQVAPLLMAQVFFVWISVFNYFAVAAFWGLMADIWEQAQGKRLFGFVAAGGSAGAILGPIATEHLVRPIGAANLVLLSAVLLELCALCVRRLARVERAGAPEPVVGGGTFTGIKVVFASPYLLLIAGYTLMATLAGTFGHNVQAYLVQAARMDQATRIVFFARLDWIVSAGSLVAQSLVVGLLLTRFGAGTVLALLPPLSSAGFAVLAALPLLDVAAGLQALRRVLAYGIWVPSNGVLFTVVDREQKYKSKAFIDTVVSRGGDVLAGNLVGMIMTAGWGVRGAALVAVPIGMVWLVLAVALGRMHQRMASANVR